MNKQFRSFLTVNLVNLSVVLAGLMLLAFGLVLARDAWQARQAIGEVQKANLAIDALLAATDAQARERGLTAALIGSPPPGAVPADLIDLHEEVGRAWRRVDEGMADVIEDLPADSPILQRLSTQRQAREALAARRSKVEEYLLDRGDAPTLDDWFDTATNLNAADAALRLELMLATPMPADTRRLNLLIRESAARLAEYAGQVRGLVAFHAASGEPMAEEQLEMARFAFRLARRYRRELLQAASELDHNGRIAEPLEALSRTSSAPAASMLDAAETGAYPLSAEAWYRVTTASIDRVFDLIDATSRLTLERLHERARRELTALLVYVLLAGSAVALALLSLQRVRANAELVFLHKEMSETILDSVADAVIAVDEAGRVRYVNPIAEELTGWPLSEARGESYQRVFRIMNRLHTSMTDPIGASLNEGLVVILSEGHVLIDRQGREVPIDDSCAPIRNQHGEVAGAVVVFSSKERERNSDRILTYHATRDALTDLYNRRAFERQLHDLAEQARRDNVCHTMAFIDLDNFKVVNDNGGHAAGDQMLRQIAFLMKQQVRDTDVLARIGGDEFGLLLRQCTARQAGTVAEKLLGAIRELRFPWNGRTYKVGLSIGLVEITAESPSIEELVREADAACYAAKDRGRNRIQVYSPKDMELARRQGQMQWAARITQALDENRLALYCQAIEPLRSDQPRCLEVLVRLLTREGEVITPDAFIPAAERHGIMPDIDRWVVEQVCRKIPPLLDADPRLRIHVNLSGLTLSDPELVTKLADIVDRHGLDARRICFEVTETAAVASLDTAVNVMERLSLRGFSFALDDFGAGLSSLTYLKNLPVDMVKIDGAFIHGLHREPVDAALVDAIARIAGLMGIRTCAEFVENAACVEKLREIGIDYAQGFHFDRPIPLIDHPPSRAPATRRADVSGDRPPRSDPSSP